MTVKSSARVGYLNAILAQGGGNLNNSIFKSSNARGLPEGGGCWCFELIGALREELSPTFLSARLLPRLLACFAWPTIPWGKRTPLAVYRGIELKTLSIREVFEEYNYFDCVTLITNSTQCCNVTLSGSAVTRGHSCRLLTE